MRILAILAAVLAVAVGVAACGGDDSDEDATAATPAEATELVDIVDTAVAAGDFTTLAAALEAGDLIETLKGEGPFTVFAPTDDAFAALPEGTLDELLAEENRDQLVSILTYHVAEGAVASTDLSDGQEIPTVQGDDVAITISEDGGVMVNEANVVTADIEASNGIIHVVDAVLIPPAE